MFKLLTDNARKNVSREYALRRAIVALAGISSVLLVGVIALLPSYILSYARINEAKARREELNASPVRQGSADLVKWLDDTNQKLAAISSTGNEDKPYEYFLKIIGAKTGGIKINQLIWGKDKKSTIVSVEGTASDRNSLLDFENKINASGAFAKTVLPVSNFAKDKDIQFNLSLVVAK